MISSGSLVQTTEEMTRLVTRLQLWLKVRLKWLRLRLFWPAWWPAWTYRHSTLVPSGLLRQCGPGPSSSLTASRWWWWLGCQFALLWPCKRAFCCLAGHHSPSVTSGPHPFSLLSRSDSSGPCGTWHPSSRPLSGPSSCRPSCHVVSSWNTFALPFPNWKIWPAWWPAWRCWPAWVPG